MMNKNKKIKQNKGKKQKKVLRYKASNSVEETHGSRSSFSKGKRRYVKHNDEFDPKIKYPTFKGNTNPDLHLDCEMKFEQIFRMSDI